MSPPDARAAALEELYRRGAHLFAFSVTRNPDDPDDKQYVMPDGWQKDRQPIAQVLEGPNVGLIAGSLGLSIPDVDTKGCGTLAERQKVGNAGAEAVMRWAGHTPYIQRTPSRGAHLFYKAEKPHGKRVVPVPGIKGNVEIFGTTGFVELYDPERLLKMLDKLPVFPSALLEPQAAPTPKGGGGKPARGNSGKGRGRTEGDRNAGTFARARCAAENDADPGPAIAQAVRDACAAGLPRLEAVTAAENGAMAGFKTRLKPGASVPVQAAKEEEPVPDCPVPEVAGYAPPMPGVFEPSEDVGRDPTDQKWVYTPRLLAEKFALTERDCHVYAKGETRGRWLVWRRGWKPDPGASMAREDMSLLGERVYHTKDDKDGPASPSNLAPNHIAGGQAKLANDALSYVPAYRGMSFLESEFDRDPCLLGLPQGKCFDLRLGKVRDAHPQDRLTLATPVLPVLVQSAFIVRLVDYLAPDGDTREALRRGIGSMLWGIPMLKALFFIPGKRNAGKSLFLELLKAALGPYAGTMQASTFTTRARGFDVDNANALLRGTRLVTVSEIAANQVLDPVRLNAVSGSDTLVSRKIGRDMLATPPSHSMLLAFNDLPKVDVHSGPEAAQALFERVRVIRFAKALPKDLAREGYQHALQDKAELGATLHWLLECALAFKQHGEAPISGFMRNAAEEWWEGLHANEDSYKE